MKHPVPMERPAHDAPVADSSMIEAQRWLSGLIADLADSMNGLTLRGARSVPIGQAVQGTMRPLASGAAGRLVGWSMRECTGSGSVLVRIFDGHDSNGILLATIPLSAITEAATSSSSSTESLPGGGVSITDGLTIVIGDPVQPWEPATGNVEGTLWIGAAE